MARLPQPGSDQGTWGDILNDFLAVSHNTDGSLKTSALSSKADASHTHAQSDITNLTTDLAAKEAIANKGANNGYMGLDSSGVGASAPKAHASRHIATDPVIVSGTLAGRPAAGSAAAPWYFATDVSAGTLYKTDGSTWAAVSPGLNVAGTELGFADLASDPATITTSAADISGLSITVSNAPSQLVVRASIPQVTFASTTVSSYVVFVMTDSSNAVLAQAIYMLQAAVTGTSSAPLMLEARLPRTGGANAYAITAGNSYTFKVRAQTSTGTATIATGTGNHRPYIQALAC